MADGCLLDSNILLRLMWLKDEYSASVESTFASLLSEGRPLHFTLQNASEFWNICTRPAKENGLGLTPAHAEEGLRLIERHVTPIADSSNVYVRWREIVRRYEVKGKQVHDAKLVAAMLAYNIPQILTLNVGDFKRYQGITVTSPLDVTRG